MQLHEFMCPQVCPDNQWLRDNPGALADYPASLITLCDFDAGMLHFQKNKQRALASLPISALDSVEDLGMNKAERTIELVQSLRGRVRGAIVANMRDAAPFDPELYFGREVNILQYNRRKGCRSAVLWRLPGYYEPSEKLGGTFQREVTETLRFRDKKPKIFWRGAFSGGRWLNPWHRSTPGKPTDIAAIEAAAPWNSRALAVLFGAANSDFCDLRFGINRRKLNLKPGEPPKNRFMGRQVKPEVMLEHRYLLCPAGHDVATQTYWILNTNSVALKEETEYEVLPDYFLKPWVHYVPIAPGLTDLREKFDYLEANPVLCEAIVERAQEAYARIIRPEPWQEAEEIVLDRLGVKI